ncbi:ProQ/FINO family protein [Inhella gelatinilytica]|uniref:ProQ/FinO family protein n=1 Tax=Inhella gelatinilytica TaxID=2795030 RepID=A0A931IW56_9BURK|nr:ProQ/FinO family protein [Inhella gelatinilytica]MBH9553945.1 ProQ/FinO family protein [Inhella gelatinilytica]
MDEVNDEKSLEGAQPAGVPTLRDAAAVGEWLKREAAALFSGTPKPIKLHIQKDIEARFPGQMTKAALTGFLRRHTSSTSYLIALTKSATRFDLDGQPAGELSEAHRAAAKEALAERRERHRQREAEMEQARQWRADLLRDWGRSTLSRTNFCALKGVAEAALDALLEQARQEAAQALPRQSEGRPSRAPHGRGGVREDRPTPARGPRQTSAKPRSDKKQG